MTSRALKMIDVTGLETQPASELMLRVAERATNHREAEAAFAEIVRRYRNYFYTVCDNFLSGRVCEGRPEVTGISADDLLSITLNKIWLNADKFDEPGGLNPEQQEKCFLAWCGKVANRVCLDELSKIDQEEVRDDLFWDNWPETGDQPPSNPKLWEAFQEAFEMLSPKSREILLATAYYMRPSARHQRIPPEENQALAARFGVTPAALRKSRERSYDHIIAFIISKGITIQRNPKP